MSQHSAASRPAALLRTPGIRSRFRWLTSMFAIVAVVWMSAAAADLATGQRWSAIWGSSAIVATALLLLPALRAAVPMVAGYASVWLAFLAGRAVADDLFWDRRTLGLIGRADRVLFGGAPGDALQAPVQGSALGAVVDWMSAGVYLSYFVVPHVVALWLLVRYPAAFWPFVRSLTMLFAVAVVCFALLPAAPPWHEQGGGVERIVPALLGGTSVEFDPNPVASMPSLHLAVTALLVPFAGSRRLRNVAISYTVAMGFSLVYLGEHHVLDVLVGVAAAALVWRATRGLTRADGITRIGGAGLWKRPNRLSAT